MRPTRYTARWILAGFAALLPAAGVAQAPLAGEAAEVPEARRYTVEIILFRYADSVPAGNELFLPDPPPEPAPRPPWPDDEPRPEIGDTAAAPAGAGPTAAEGLDPANATLEEIRLPSRAVDLEVTLPGDLKLTDVHRKLVSLDAYEPVLWAGWTQDVIERDLSPVIPLRRIGNAPPEFDGTLQLYLSRFLHLVVDLSLTPRNSAGSIATRSYGDRPDYGRFDVPSDPGETGVVHLRIDEDRIVRDGELRYFDHPKFGLLARVTRVDDETATPDTGDDTDALLPPE